MPSTEYTYDVFISYRHQEPDQAWVRNTLMPRLKAEGVRVCVDYECFRLGAPLILEMARAVEQSRYTLAILTPAYLTSNFTELENVMAEHLGLEESQRRLIAVMREPCKPRLGMRVRLWLDMTDDAQLESSTARLVWELRQSGCPFSGPGKTMCDDFLPATLPTIRIRFVCIWPWAMPSKGFTMFSDA